MQTLGLVSESPAGVSEEPYSRLLRWSVGFCALVAIVIGGSLFLVPSAFYASYGVELTHSPALLSDIRGNGATFFLLGCVFALGAWGAVEISAAACLAAAFYLAFGASRVLSFFVDGVPPEGIIQAGAVELLLGGVTAGLALAKRRRAV